MQSLIQYRQLGKGIQKQFEREKEKIGASTASSPQRDGLGNETPAPERTTVLEQEHSSNLVIEPTVSASSDSTTHDSPPAAVDLEKAPTHKDDLDLNNTPIEDRPAVFGSHVERTHTLTSQKSKGTALGKAFTGVSIRKPTAKEGGGDRAVFVVGYQGERDPMNPHNWSYAKRWGATCNVALIGWIVGFASSVDSGALEPAAEYFGVSEVAESLATGLFLVGFGCGGLAAGPFSEEFGRNPIYIATLGLYMIFIMASALSPNVGAQFAFRFIAGFFGATPLSCAGGSVSDLWDPVQRVWAFPIFANAAFMGPLFGPVVGGWIGMYIEWQWTEWVTLIVSAAIFFSVVLFQPETYTPILLKWKAAHLRKITGDERYVASVEIRADNFGQRLVHALYRPFQLTFHEPIVLLFGLYLTVVYVILFTFLNGYTFIFSDVYGLSPGLTGVCFLGIAVGLCLASLLIPFVKKHYERSAASLERKHNEDGTEDKPAPKLPPEIRLVWAMIGAPFIPISIFWMGWTARESISVWSPIAASVVFGFGILCVFISTYQYLIDAYEVWAASALASVTFIRYVAAGGMVEVSIPFYENLGVDRTLSVLGGISAAMVPVPYLFWIFGEKIRSLSKFAASA